MKCQQVHLQLPDYATRKLSEQEQSFVSDHLASCSECRSELTSIREAVTAISQLHVEPPPEPYFNNLLPRIHERIEQQSVRRIPEWAFRYLLPFGAAFVMVLVLWRAVPTGEMNPADMESIFRQLQPDEIRQIVDDQTVAKISGTISDENGLTAGESDKDIVKELVQNNEDETLYAGIDIQSATENLTNTEADELLAYLQTTSDSDEGK